MNINEIDLTQTRWPMTKKKNIFQKIILRWFSMPKDGICIKYINLLGSLPYYKHQYDKEPIGLMSLKGVHVDQYNFCSPCLLLSVPGKDDKIILHLHTESEDTIQQVIDSLEIASCSKSTRSLLHSSRGLDSLYPVEENVSDYDENYPILQHSESPIDGRYCYTKRGKLTNVIKKRWFEINDDGELIYYYTPHDIIPKGKIPLDNAIIKDYDRSPVICHKHIIENIKETQSSTIINNSNQFVLTHKCLFCGNCHFHYHTCNRYKSCFELHIPDREWGYLVIHSHDSHIDSANDSRSYIESRILMICNRTDLRQSNNNNNNTSTTGSNGSINGRGSFHSLSNVNHKIGISDFILIRMIGQGAFGKVMLVRKIDNSQIYAMKIINKHMIHNQKQIDHTLSERKILEQIRHPFIVQLYYAFQTDTKLYFVMDYCGGGDLFHRLGNKKQLNEEDTLFYICEIILALCALHSANIIYRDLKPENVLLDKNGHIRLADFGLAKIGKDNSNNVEGNTFCGSANYLAPEIINQSSKGYSIEVDWWSLGCLMYQMIVGVPPFYCGNNNVNNNNILYNNILRGQVSFPDSMSREAKNFIRGLLEKDPLCRLGSGKSGEEDVKSDPLFKKYKINWNEVFNKSSEPPFIPQIRSLIDTSNFDNTYTDKSIGTDSSIHSEISMSEIDDDAFAGFSYEKSGTSIPDK